MNNVIASFAPLSKFFKRFADERNDVSFELAARELRPAACKIDAVNADCTAAGEYGTNAVVEQAVFEVAVCGETQEEQVDVYFEAIERK